MAWNFFKQKTNFFSNDYYNKIQYFLAHVPGNLYWKTWEGYYLGCNTGLLKLLGLEEKDFIDKTDQQLWPEYAAAFKNYEEKIIFKQEISSFNITVVLRSGEKKYLLVSSNTCVIGKRHILIGNVQDITVYVKKEIELQEQHNTTDLYLQKIVDSSPGNIYWKNKDGIYLGCNENTIKISKLRTKSDLVGKSDQELWPGSAESITQNDQLVLQNGQTITEEKVGNNIYLSTKTPFFDKDNNIVGIIGNSIDITLLKETQEQLRDANQKLEIANNIKTSFLENIRHDIRTPLSGIISLAELLKDESDPAKIREYSYSLGEASQELSHFLNKVLESITIMTGKLPLLKKKFGLKNILQQVVKLHAAKATEKNLSLNFSFDPNVPEYLIGDPERTYRIVLELLSNALKFTATGMVNITVKLNDKKNRDLDVVIIIEDTGIGIDPKQQKEIFIRFNRLNPTYQSIYKGLGLGLSIVKQFIDELEGEIYVDSKGANSGSKFYCFIPFKESIAKGLFEENVEISNIEKHNSNLLGIKDKVLTPAPAASTIVGSENTPSILLVEDHAMVAYAEKDMLTKLTCQVDHAADGKSAIELAKKNQYALIFMDIGLPDLDGYEVTRQIRQQEALQGEQQRVPIVALTAHVDSENHQACIDAGMDAVLNKPLTIQMAKDTLARYMSCENEKECSQV